MPDFSSARYPGRDKFPLVKVPDGAISIDGNLDDWRMLPAGYLDAVWHNVSIRGNPEFGRAKFSICRDTEALYFFVRVIDQHVIPSTTRHLFMGDVVYLFLDVRPVDASEGVPRMGQRVYSPGSYHIMLSPPKSPDEPPRWDSNTNSGPKPEQMDLVGIRYDDGFLFELRLPFSDLNGASPERFEEPVGFDIEIHNTDPEGGNSYSWGGPGPKFIYADLYKRAIPMSDEESFHSITAVQQTFFDQEQTFISGVASSIDTPLGAYDLDVTYAIDPTSGTSIQNSEAETWTRTDNELGMRVVERRLRFTDLLPGRYTFDTQFTGPDISISETTRTMYAGTDEKQVMERLWGSPDVEAVAGKIRENTKLSAPVRHVFDDRVVDIKCDLEWSPEFDWSIQEWQGKGATYRIRVDVAAIDGPVVYSREITLDREDMSVPVPVADLPEGIHVARASLLTPNGRTLPIKHTDPFFPEVIVLGIHRNQAYTRPAVLDTGEPIYKDVDILGNPNRERYPNDDRLHTFARSVWDMQAYNGRVYMGSGDVSADQGPIDMWSFRHGGQSDELVFENEYTVDEEGVLSMRVLDGRLIIPGVESTGPTELGSVYIHDGREWIRRETVPQSRHMGDVLVFQDKLYAADAVGAEAALFESSDDGRTWQRYNPNTEDLFHDTNFWALSVLQDTLIILSGHAQDRLYRFREGMLERLFIPLFPGMTSEDRILLGHRTTPFGDGVLYTLHPVFGGDRSPRPLFFLDNFETGAVVIDLFRDKTVRDILIRDEMCYVLTSEQTDTGYETNIYRSSNLDHWFIFASFPTNAHAISMEELDGRFYVGLGSFGDENHSLSGSIGRIK